METIYRFHDTSGDTLEMTAREGEIQIETKEEGEGATVLIFSQETARELHAQLGRMLELYGYTVSF